MNSTSSTTKSNHVITRCCAHFTKATFVVALPLLLGLGLPRVGRAAAPTDYQVAFSTYLGGTNFDSVRDVAVDHDGNIVVAGGTSSTNFPVTPGCFQSTLNTAGSDAASKSRLGDTDAYIAKFSPAGQLLWATYLGGTGYDRAYAVEIDPQNRIVVAGRAGPNFPTTPGAFQPNFINTLSSTVTPARCGIRGAKRLRGLFQPGRRAPLGELRLVRSALPRRGRGRQRRHLPALGLERQRLLTGRAASRSVGFPQTADLSSRQRQDEHERLRTTACSRSRLTAARFCGGRGSAAPARRAKRASCASMPARNLCFMCYTKSTDMPFNAQDQGIHTHAADGGGNDLWVGKVSADGNSLLYGTYIGGNKDEALETHQLAVDDQGNAYVALATPSTDMPITAGAMLTTFPGGTPNSGRLYAAKIGPTGKLLLGTYFPGSDFESVEGVSVDADHNLYITGATHAADFPLAGTPYQSTLGAETSDILGAGSGVTAAACGYFTVLAADFKGLVYSTCFGAGSALIHYNADGSIVRYNAYGGFHANCLAPDGSFLAVGSWYSDGFPLVNAFQPAFKSGPVYGVNNSVAHCDAVIARFVPATANPDLSFFNDEIGLGQGVYYLTFPSGNPFGYYSYLTDPAYIYHFDLGYEYCFLAHDGKSGVYFYDFASQGFFYASPVFPFPYLYDFGLDTVLYYYPDPNNPGHYNTNGVRYFYNFATGQIISK